MAVGVCRCGNPYDHGRCPHCDRVPACTASTGRLLAFTRVVPCAACEQVALHCVVCRAKHPTAASAQLCERQCRTKETKTERAG